MPDDVLFWSWLIRTAVVGGVILLAGALAASRIGAPADRLRLIQWVLVACLLTAFVPLAPGLPTVSLGLAAARVEAPDEPVGGDAEVPTAAFKAGPSTSPDPVLPVVSSGEVPASSGDAAPTDAAASPPRRSQMVSSPGSTWERIAGAIVVAYLIAAGGMAARWAAGMLRRRSIGLASREAPPAVRAAFDQIAGPAGARTRILVSDRIDGPITWGLRRPVVLIPSRFVEPAREAELRWCLAHEWSHVEHHDAASLQLAWAVQVLFFYQPLFWTLRRRMLLCQDYVADAEAARATGSAADYADFLVRLARTRVRPGVRVALGIADRKSQLYRRVTMLLGDRAAVRSRCRRRTSVLAPIGSLTLLGLLSMVTVGSDAADQSVVETVADQTPEPGVVAGQLVDAADGSPVAGAKVFLRSGGLKTAASDEAGRFRFEGVPPYPLGYELWAYRDGLATSKVQVEASPAEAPSEVGYRPLRLKMAPGRRVSFVVTAKATGEPVAGATVRFAYPDRRVVTTAEDGTASEQGLLPQAYEVTIEAEGYARSLQQFDLAAAPAGVQYRVALEPGGTVAGVAVDADGRPVPGADVVYREDGRPLWFHGDSFRTDDEGRFRHRFLPLNSAIEVAVSKEGYLRETREVVLTSDRRAEEMKVTLAPQPKGGAVSGRVLDRDGAPIANARVSNAGSDPGDERSTTTDADGRFTLGDLREDFGGIRIGVAVRGFAPQLTQVEPGTEEAPADVTVTLEPGRSFRGRLLDERRAPVAGAYVMARSTAYRIGSISIRTGADGSFAFDSLPADVKFQIAAKGRATTEAVPLALDGATPVEIVLDPPGVIRGRVVDAQTGKPLPQFRVRAGFSPSRRPGDARGSISSDLSEHGLTFRSDDGRFVVGELTSGMPLELTVESDGYERAVVTRAVAAAEAADVEVALTAKAEKPHSLTVQLFDHEGRPVPEAQLRLIVSTTRPTGPDDRAFNWALIESGHLGRKSYVEQFLSGTTDEAGRFVFGDVVPGRHLQLIHWGKGVPQDRSLDFQPSRPDGSEAVTLKLAAPATVRGTIDRDVFGDAASVRLTRLGTAFQDFEAELGPGETTFELTDLPASRYAISLDGTPIAFTENGNQMRRSNPLAGQSFDLEAGEVREVRFAEE